MPDGRHDDLLAAGMLEDFLVAHGEEYMTRIKGLAPLVPRFRSLLGGVCKRNIKKGVWHAIQAEADYPSRYGKE
jgi:hypothetical protein